MQYLIIKEFGNIQKCNNTCRSPSASDLKNVAVQFTRAAIANDKLAGEFLYQQGKIFRVPDSVPLFEAFVGHFVIDGIEASAIKKAQHCIAFTQAAFEVFKKNSAYPGNSIK